MTELQPSDEALFLQALTFTKAAGFDWRRVAPEDRGNWARKVLKEVELNQVRNSND